MNRGDLQQASALIDGLTPEFIGAPECRFARIRRVFQKRRAVMLLERWRTFRFRFRGCSHERIPVNRATTTSASSVPL
jgi:hypothetical protein